VRGRWDLLGAGVVAGSETHWPLGGSWGDLASRGWQNGVCLYAFDIPRQISPSAAARRRHCAPSVHSRHPSADMTRRWLWSNRARIAWLACTCVVECAIVGPEPILSNAFWLPGAARNAFRALCRNSSSPRAASTAASPMRPMSGSRRWCLALIWSCSRGRRGQAGTLGAMR